MTTTFNAAGTKTVRVNGTNFEFTFTRLERIAFGPGKITTLGAEFERMARRAHWSRPARPGASPLLERASRRRWPALRRRVRGRRAACARKFGAGARGRNASGSAPMRWSQRRGRQPD